MSLITVFIGALFFNSDFINDVQSIVIKVPPPTFDLRNALFVTSGIFFISLGLALVSILQSVHVRGYLIEHPADLVSALFGSSTGYLDSNTEADLYVSTAKSYAFATESDRAVNERKSEWVKLSSIFMFVALFSFMFFYGFVIYLKLA